MRKCVTKFAKLMDEVLEENNHKDRDAIEVGYENGWEYNCDIKHLLDSLKDSIIYLEEELIDSHDFLVNYRNIEKRCADIANFSMMIADLSSKSK